MKEAPGWDSTFVLNHLQLHYPGNVEIPRCESLVCFVLHIMEELVAFSDTQIRYDGIGIEVFWQHH